MHVPLVLTDFLDRAVELYGDKVAVIDEERTFTYSDLNRRVNRLARGLKNAGVEKGDKVAYLAPNSVEMLEGFYGVFSVGGIMTPLNTRLKPEEYRFILTHSESRVLLVDRELLHLVEPILDGVPTLEKVVVHGEYRGSMPIMKNGLLLSEGTLSIGSRLRRRILPPFCTRAERLEIRRASC